MSCIYLSFIVLGKMSRDERKKCFVMCCCSWSKFVVMFESNRIVANCVCAIRTFQIIKLKFMRNISVVVSMTNSILSQPQFCPKTGLVSLFNQFLICQIVLKSSTSQFRLLLINNYLFLCSATGCSLLFFKVVGNSVCFQFR